MPPEGHCTFGHTYYRAGSCEGRPCGEKMVEAPGHTRTPKRERAPGGALVCSRHDQKLACGMWVNEWGDLPKAEERSMRCGKDHIFPWVFQPKEEQPPP